MERIILESERQLITGVGRSKWYELEAAGSAPKRRVVVGRRTGWLLSELQSWVLGRPLATNPAPAEALAARGVVVPTKAA